MKIRLEGKDKQSLDGAEFCVICKELVNVICKPTSSLIGIVLQETVNIINKKLQKSPESVRINHSSYIFT